MTQIEQAWYTHTKMVTMKLELDLVVNYPLLISPTPKAPKWRRCHLNKSTTWVHIRPHTHLPPNTAAPSTITQSAKERHTGSIITRCELKNHALLKAQLYFPATLYQPQSKLQSKDDVCCLKCRRAKNNVKSIIEGQNNASNARVGERRGENGLIPYFFFFF